MERSHINERMDACLKECEELEMIFKGKTVFISGGASESVICAVALR